MQRLNIARSDDAVAPTRSTGVQTYTRLSFKDTRGDLTWSVVGDSREVASGIMNYAAGFYKEAILEPNGSKRVLQFQNFDVDAVGVVPATATHI